MSWRASEGSYKPPKIADLLLRAAARQLPAELSERYATEWAAECAALSSAGSFSVVLFALRVRLNIRATLQPYKKRQGCEEADSGQAGVDGEVWIANPAAVAETLRQLLERHAAPPLWADVLDAMRSETAEVDDLVQAGIKRSHSALAATLELDDQLHERLRVARADPLALPASSSWPRANSTRQLWQVTDASELESEHLQNELNWLVESELRRARRSFEGVALPSAMLAAMRDSGHQALTLALSAWQELSADERPNLDVMIRARVRQAYELRLMPATRQIGSSPATTREPLSRRAA